MYQLRETFFGELDSLDIQDTDGQKLSKNVAVFPFEYICISKENLSNIETTTLIGEHVPLSVSISSKLIGMPSFLCNYNPRVLVESLIHVVEDLAT